MKDLEIISCCAQSRNISKKGAYERPFKFHLFSRKKKDDSPLLNSLCLLFNNSYMN
jgi:hypothetical protein